MNRDLTVLATPDCPSLADLAPLYLHLSVTDPETIAALSESAEGRDRQELALTALKIGILSLKAARGTVDGAAIRQEGDRLLGTPSGWVRSVRRCSGCGLRRGRGAIDLFATGWHPKRGGSCPEGRPTSSGKSMQIKRQLTP